MNTNYSLRRIGLLLRADWMEYKKGYLLGMGILLLIWMLFLYTRTMPGNPVGNQTGFWYVGVLVSFFLFCQHTGRKMHRSKGIYMLLPASNGEKYTALLLEGLIYFVGFQIVFWGGLLLWMPFIPDFTFPSLSQIYYSNNVNNGSEAGLFFIASLLFLAYMSFRKHPFLIAVGGMAAYALLFTLVALSIVEKGRFRDAYFQSFYQYDTVGFLVDGYTPIMVASSLVVMYVAYLKLKEKEQR